MTLQNYDSRLREAELDKWNLLVLLQLVPELLFKCASISDSIAPHNLSRSLIVIKIGHKSLESTLCQGILQVNNVDCEVSLLPFCLTKEENVVVLTCK